VEFMKADVNTYRSVTPYLVVQDADAEIKFLKAAFAGTETVCERNPENRQACRDSNRKLSQYAWPG